MSTGSTLPADFVANLEAPSQVEVGQIMLGVNKPFFRITWKLNAEILPSDLYCYLGVRFGKPNGIQSLLRDNSSDNLIHWEWFLRSRDSYLLIQGMNFRTEIHAATNHIVDSGAKNLIIEQIKNDFARFGKELSVFRKTLEPWTEFVNPFQRIRRAVYRLLAELNSLELDAEVELLSDSSKFGSIEAFIQAWNDQAAKVSQALGLCFGIRSMLPVMAEAYVNLLMYVLLKPEIKRDERLRESKVRQQIDIRIRSLSHDCSHFEKHIDYEHDACKNYHSLVNERNDLLHGNIVIEKLKFNELFFDGKVPVFRRYLTTWERALGIEQDAVGLSKVRAELKVVEDLVEYLNSCLDDRTRERMDFIASRYNLGIRQDTGTLGVLFPEHLVDFIFDRNVSRGETS